MGSKCNLPVEASILDVNIHNTKLAKNVHNDTMDTSIYRNIYVTWHENFFPLSLKQVKENDSCEFICTVCIYIYTQQ